MAGKDPPIIGFFDSLFYGDDASLYQQERRLQEEIAALTAEIDQARKRSSRSVFPVKLPADFEAKLERLEQARDELQDVQDRIGEKRQAQRDKIKESQQKAKEDFQQALDGLEQALTSDEFKQGVKNFFMLNPEIRKNMVQKEKDELEIEKIRREKERLRAADQPKQLEPPKKPDAETRMEKDRQKIQAYKQYKKELEESLPGDAEAELRKNLLDRWIANHFEGEE